MPQAPSQRSDLVALVETEARLDRALADARARARALIETARRAADASLRDEELAEQRDRIAMNIDAARTAQIAAISEQARADQARCAALDGPALAALAHRLGLQLIEVALDEVPR